MDGRPARELTEPLFHISGCPEYKDKQYRPAVKVTMDYSPSMFPDRDAAVMEWVRHYDRLMRAVEAECDRLNAKDG